MAGAGGGGSAGTGAGIGTGSGAGTLAAYERLLAHVREAALLESTAAILSWDQETMMPPGGIEHRARQLAQLARMAHALRTDPRQSEWIEACRTAPALADDADRAADAAANLREIARRYERARRLPEALVSELAEVTSLAQHEWAAAREHSDFPRFRPWLERVLQLLRRQAECLGTPPGGEPWDALADDYEPGLTVARCRELFPPLRERSKRLLHDLLGGRRRPDPGQSRVELPIARQEEFVRTVAAQIGFDFQRGRLDRSAHPFCGGSHCGDVRITTRFAEDKLLDALGSVLHEAGHGMYEQGLLREHVGTPLGEAVSLAIHESQSRLWENQVGRSLPFWEWCAPRLAAFFAGDAAPHAVNGDPQAWYAAANVVEPSLIRVEADEVTYDLHVAIRFDLEVALLHGDLPAADLPGEWNRQYREHLGLTVPDDRRGCLQDVHWSCGLFGYFPTYTLGNLYAAQLYARARQELPDLEAGFARGEFAPLRDWLARNVHRHGRRWPPAELCRRVTGAPLSVEPRLAYLEAKLRPLYGA